MKPFFHLLGVICLSGLASTAHAEDGFSPGDICFEHMQGASSATKIMIAAWSSGFLASKDNNPQPVDFAKIETLLSDLQNTCGQNPGFTFWDAVAVSEAPSENVAGSEAHAHEFLLQFLDPASDLEALTRAMKPNEADIRVIYQESLASKLLPYIDRLFRPGLALGPSEGQSELIVIHATTNNLLNGDAVLDEFPGGYSKVLEFMNEGFSIVRFKFVAPGETSGMAYDGLVHVNGRWVLIPKPWGALR